MKTKNPWKGFATYEESDASSFKGRDEEVATLLNLVLESDIVVCYSESGAGKSSLIRAGLIPELRKNHYFPIFVNFDYAKYVSDTKIPYEHIFETAISEAVGTQNAKQSNIDNGILYEWKNVVKISDNVPEKLESSLWWKLRTKRIVRTYGDEVISEYEPIFIFDQFERIFYKTANEKQVTDFFKCIKELVINRVPDKFEDNDELNFKISQCFNSANSPFKILISLREEYVGKLQYYSSEIVPLPSLVNNTFYLPPLTIKNAQKVILDQDVNTLSQVVDDIIEISRNGNNISAIILSVICSNLYDNARVDNDGEVIPVSKDDLTQSKSKIIESYYLAQMAKTKIQPNIISIIESLLVDKEGKRNLIPLNTPELKKIKFSQRYKDILETNGIIRGEEINGIQYIELIHDRVAEVISQRRRTREKLRHDNMLRIFLIIFSLGILGFAVFSSLFSIYPKNQYQSYLFSTSSETCFGDANMGKKRLIIKDSVVNIQNLPDLKSVKVLSSVKNLSISDCPNLVRVDFEGDDLDSLSISSCPRIKNISIPINTIYHKISYATVTQSPQRYTDSECQFTYLCSGITTNKRNLIILPYSRYPGYSNLTIKGDSIQSIFLPWRYHNKENEHIVLEGVNKKNVDLKVPCGSLDSYLNREEYSEFRTIEEISYLEETYYRFRYAYEGAIWVLKNDKETKIGIVALLVILIAMSVVYFIITFNKIKNRGVVKSDKILMAITVISIINIISFFLFHWWWLVVFAFSICCGLFYVKRTKSKGKIDSKFTLIVYTLVYTFSLIALLIVAWIGSYWSIWFSIETKNYLACSIAASFLCLIIYLIFSFDSLNASIIDFWRRKTASWKISFCLLIFILACCFIWYVYEMKKQSSHLQEFYTHTGYENEMSEFLIQSIRDGNIKLLNDEPLVRAYLNRLYLDSIAQPTKISGNQIKHWGINGFLNEVYLIEKDSLNYILLDSKDYLVPKSFKLPGIETENILSIYKSSPNKYLILFKDSINKSYIGFLSRSYNSIISFDSIRPLDFECLEFDKFGNLDIEGTDSIFDFKYNLKRASGMITFGKKGEFRIEDTGSIINIYDIKNNLIKTLNGHRYSEFDGFFETYNVIFFDKYNDDKVSIYNLKNGKTFKTNFKENNLEYYTENFCIFKNPKTKEEIIFDELNNKTRKGKDTQWSGGLGYKDWILKCDTEGNLLLYDLKERKTLFSKIISPKFSSKVDIILPSPFLSYDKKISGFFLKDSRTLLPSKYILLPYDLLSLSTSFTISDDGRYLTYEKGTEYLIYDLKELYDIPTSELIRKLEKRFK